MSEDTPIIKLSDEELKEVNETIAIHATDQSRTVIAQAQRLFYEIWNKEGNSISIKDGVFQFRRCLEMAEEIRLVCLEEQTKRVKKIQAEYDAEMKKHSPDGQSRIILPSSTFLQEHRLGNLGMV